MTNPVWLKRGSLRRPGFVILLLCGFSFADVTCTPTTPVSNQSRTDMKHRAPGLRNVSVNQTSVPEMLNWPNPTKIVKSSGSPIDTRETQAFTLNGDLWHVKIEGNDCDFHLEVSGPGDSSSADRVIVEVAQGPAFTQIRNLLIDALMNAGEGDLRNSKSLDLSQPLPIQVTGFAFFDAFHYSRSNPKRGHGHGTSAVGTIWELHPVWQLSVRTGTRPTLATGGAHAVMGEPGGAAPEGVFDFAISRSFLEKLEGGNSISPAVSLTLGEHSAIHNLLSDCEMHVAGTPEGTEFGWPNAVVVEPPNLCHFDPQGSEGGDTSAWLATFDDLAGQKCQVTGFPRIFTEHASGAGGASNPNHVFEIHPALSIGCGDQRISFQNFLTALPGMRAISPATAASCIADRQLEVRFDSNSQQYVFRETGGRCGNFAIVEVDAVNPSWIRSISGGHSAIARVTADGQTTATLKIYTLAPSAMDAWLGASASSPGGPSSSRLLHGLFTYDYYAIEKVVHPRGGDWQTTADWTRVPFPLAFIVFGEAESAPWSQE